MADHQRLPPNVVPCWPSKLHYSFDFAQQFHFPSDPFQPGPIYFLTPRKCGLFGICCEGIPRQVNYLIDESVAAGKGANTVISLLHHFFEMHGQHELHASLNADNCTGQNKNNAVVQVIEAHHIDMYITCCYIIYSTYAGGCSLVSTNK